jgi:Mlc titration factor MtfA (ptsG expression regulator)
MASLWQHWSRWRRTRTLERRPIPDGLVASDARSLPVSRPSQRRRRRSAARTGDAVPDAKGILRGRRTAGDRRDGRWPIAAQACVPILQLGLDCYDGFIGIVVHPDAVVARRETVDEAGVVHRYTEELSGEAMEGGPLMLSWRDVAEGGMSANWGYNVVIHEFVHVLDMHAGRVGIPSRGLDADWSRRLAAEYDRFAERVDAGEETLVDPYGAEAIEEFFAVAAEAFFVAPRELRAEEPTLYDLLAAFFRQHPADSPRHERREPQLPSSFCCVNALGSGGRRLRLRLVAALGRLDIERRLAVGIDVDRQPPAIDQATEQQFVGQRTPDRVLDQTLHRTCAHQRIETLLGELTAQTIGERDLDLLLAKLALQLQQELVDDPQDDFLVERLEADDGIETVAELRREEPLDVGHLVALLARVREADRRLAERLGARHSSSSR